MNRSNLWFFFPLGALLLAVFVLLVNDGIGMDGAARTTAILFWYAPTVLYLGCMSFTHWKQVNISTAKKFIVVAIWLLTSIPLCLVSIFGIMLLSETGFGILF